MEIMENDDTFFYNQNLYRYSMSYIKTLMRVNNTVEQLNCINCENNHIHFLFESILVKKIVLNYFYLL